MSQQTVIRNPAELSLLEFQRGKKGEIPKKKKKRKRIRPRRVPTDRDSESGPRRVPTQSPRKGEKGGKNSINFLGKKVGNKEGTMGGNPKKKKNEKELKDVA